MWGRERNTVCVRNLLLKGGEGKGKGKGNEIQEVVTMIFKGLSAEKAWVWALCLN